MLGNSPRGNGCVTAVIFPVDQQPSCPTGKQLFPVASTNPQSTRAEQLRT
jgi:hypothetical protein